MTNDIIFQLIRNELSRQQNQIELIASENFASVAVLKAMGSVFTNKYAEGYPGKRYYGGCSYVDEVEKLAIERLCSLFKCKFANVQPHSGAQANLAAFFALAKPGDKILGMNLAAGGHLTHGAPPTLSGKWFNAVSYGTHDGLINYNEVLEIAQKEKPKIIIAGASSYPRKIDFKAFREIADKVGAYLVADIAHYAGLIAAGEYPSSIPYAHVSTATTHKTLRGPRGGIIMCNDEDLAKKINSAVFPGIQGGPLMHIIAAKAVAFGEALKPEFKEYAKSVISNAIALGESLKEKGIKIVSDGTDCHMVIADLRDLKITGKDAETILEEVGITCNKNGVPSDPLPPSLSSGIRLGTPACTTRGFRNQEFKEIGEIIGDLLVSMGNNKLNDDYKTKIRNKVTNMCDKFPIYKELINDIS